MGQARYLASHWSSTGAARTNWCWCWIYLCSHNTIGFLIWVGNIIYIYIYIHMLKTVSAALDIDCKRYWFGILGFTCGVVWKVCNVFLSLYKSCWLAKRHRIWAEASSLGELAGDDPFQPQIRSNRRSQGPKGYKGPKGEGKTEERDFFGTSSENPSVPRVAELRCFCFCFISHFSFKVYGSCPSTSRLSTFFTFGSSPGANTFVC